MMQHPIKLFILTSHPIQYQAPLFRRLAAEPGIALTVYFVKDTRDAAKNFDPEFGRPVTWDIPLLDGYASVFVKSVWNFLSALRTERPDVLLLYGWNSFLARCAAVAARLFGIPFMIHSENPLNQEMRKSFWKRFLKRITLGTLLRMAHACLFIGRESKKFYMYYSVSDEKLFFTPYAVENERFMKAADTLTKKEYKKRLGIASEAVTILFSGKLIEKKRPLDLLAAYACVASEHTSLLFVGDGALRGEIEAHASREHIPGVRVTGFVNQSEMPACYAAADIFVLPSGDGETWGLAVNEAMCFGVPVIVSDRVGCGPDLVNPGENGFIVPFGDVPALADALGALVRDRARREAYGARSREIIRRYDFSADIAGIKDALAHLAARA